MLSKLTLGLAVIIGKDTKITAQKESLKLEGQRERERERDYKLLTHLAFLTRLVATQPPALLIVDDNQLLALGYRELVVFLGNVPVSSL